MDMLDALEKWMKGKRAAKGLSRKQIAALVISVIGGWLFYLSMVQQGGNVGSLRDTLLDEWATRWAAILDLSG